MQFEAKEGYPEGAALMIPELLDRLAALGDFARQVSNSLGGGNGHRAGAMKELLETIRKV